MTAWHPLRWLRYLGGQGKEKLRTESEGKMVLLKESGEVAEIGGEFGIFCDMGVCVLVGETTQGRGTCDTGRSCVFMCVLRK